MMNPMVEALMKRLRDGVAATPELAGFDLLQWARPSVRLIARQTPLDRIALGASRIGGLPDLPAGFEWPRWEEAEAGKSSRGKSRPAVPLGFIAQLDLEAIPKIDDALPASGWLVFFYDWSEEPWGFDPNDRGCCRVAYFDGPRSALQRTNAPEEMSEEHVADACAIDLRIELTLPDDVENMDYGTPADDAYRALREELSGDSGDVAHRLLGEPQVVQNPMELECQLASNGVNCGGPAGYETAQAKALADGARDWRLLLQIDTDEDGPGWMWGDVGRIYFWIKQQDLAAHRFDDVWLILQCH